MIGYKNLFKVKHGVFTDLIVADNPNDALNKIINYYTDKNEADFAKVSVEYVNFVLIDV